MNFVHDVENEVQTKLNNWDILLVRTLKSQTTMQLISLYKA